MSSRLRRLPAIAVGRVAVCTVRRARHFDRSDGSSSTTARGLYQMGYGLAHRVDALFVP